VCYLLGLSHIDPIATRLFIGRFLSETSHRCGHRLDFPREIREELIRRVYTRYGHEHVGLVCSFPTYRLRSTVREIGKALDLPPGEIEQVAKLADRRSGGLADELDQLPGFTGAGARRSGKSCASSPRRSRACRGTFPSTWAGWSSRAGRSWRSCRSSEPPWQTACVPVGQGFLRRRPLH